MKSHVSSMTNGCRVLDVPMATNCGGCEGMGAHRRICPTQPGWNWARLYMIADELGDSIGSNDIKAANMAYAIAGRMKKRWLEAR